MSFWMTLDSLDLAQRLRGELSGCVALDIDWSEGRLGPRCQMHGVLHDACVAHGFTRKRDSIS